MVVPETNSRVEKYVTLSIFQANVSNWKHESLVDIRFGLSKKRSSDPNEIVKDIFFLKKLSKIWHGWPLFWFMCDVIPPNSKLYGEKSGHGRKDWHYYHFVFLSSRSFTNLSIRRIRPFQEKEAASDHLIWYFYWSFAEIYHQTLFLANFLTVCLMTWLPLGTCMYQ